MIRITYIEHDGRRHTVEAQAGHTLMHTAVSNGVPGIDADCGGSCICATCHIHVDAPWGDRLERPAEAEQWTLEGAVELQPETSRLSCQIQVSEAMDGLVVCLPQSQR